MDLRKLIVRIITKICRHTKILVTNSAKGGGGKFYVKYYVNL
jgi:hypothetical protein